MAKPVTAWGRLVTWFSLTFGSLRQELDLATVAGRVQELISQVPKGEQQEALQELKGKLNELQGKTSNEFSQVFKSCMDLIPEPGRGSPPPKRRRIDRTPSPKRERIDVERASAVAEILTRSDFKPFLKATPAERAMFEAIGHPVAGGDEEEVERRIVNRCLRGDLKDVALQELGGHLALAALEERVAIAGIHSDQKGRVVDLLVLARSLEGKGRGLRTESLRKLYEEILVRCLSEVAEHIESVAKGEMEIGDLSEPLTKLASTLVADPEKLWMAKYASDRAWIASQNEDEHKVLGEGVCLAVTVDTAIYLMQHPHATADDVHRHLSRRAGEHDNPTAIFNPTHRKMQAELGLESQASLQLSPRTLRRLEVHQKCHPSQTLEGGKQVVGALQKLNRERKLEGANGSFVIDMGDDEGGHVFNCQISTQHGWYRFMDTNYGMWEFDDFKSFSHAFASYIDAMYGEEYSYFSISHFTRATASGG